MKLSFKEEVANAISHGVMFILFLVSIPWVAILSYQKMGWLLSFGNSVFMISLCLMFLSSTLYHSMSYDSEHKRIFRILDHIFIFVAIAGTYTPVALISIKGYLGIVVLAIQWICVLGGILYKVFSKNYNKKIGLTFYLIMGWLAVIFLPVIWKNTSWMFIVLIALGGVMYSIGSIFYALKKPYYHFIWHIFIDVASICHFIALVFYFG